MNQVIKIMAMNLNENRINKIKERKLKFNLNNQNLKGTSREYLISKLEERLNKLTTKSFIIAYNDITNQFNKIEGKRPHNTIGKVMFPIYKIGDNLFGDTKQIGHRKDYINIIKSNLDKIHPAYFKQIFNEWDIMKINTINRKWKLFSTNI